MLSGFQDAVPASSIDKGGFRSNSWMFPYPAYFEGLADVPRPPRGCLCNRVAQPTQAHSNAPLSPAPPQALH